MFPPYTTINRVTITCHLPQPSMANNFNITHYLELSDFDDDYDEVEYEEADFINGLDPELLDDNEIANNYFQVTIFR